MPQVKILAGNTLLLILIKQKIWQCLFSFLNKFIEFFLMYAFNKNNIDSSMLVKYISKYHEAKIPIKIAIPSFNLYENVTPIITDNE